MFTNTMEQNHFLSALPVVVKKRLCRHLKPVQLEMGDVLFEAGGKISYVYFPTTFIASMLNSTLDGDSVEIAMVGNEGVVGGALVLGGGRALGDAVVQSTGRGFQLRGHLLKEEFERGGVLMQLMLRYTQGLMTQMSQTAACNRHHTVYEQLCRWLLMSLDRLPSNSLEITQEQIANRLGVRREGVTVAAGKLQSEGIIHYHRGHITVLNRAGLETRTCECYEVVKMECARLDLIASSAYL